MKKIILFVLLIGISLGLIISSTINMIYSKHHKIEDIENKKVVKTVKIHKKELDKQKEKKEDTKINKEEILNNTINQQKNENKQEEYVSIIIQDGYNSSQIADILYEKGLISSKEDFKILFNLKTIDVYKAGDTITRKGIISSGWKINLLLKMLNKNYDKLSDTLYSNQLIDDKDSFNFFLSTLKTSSKVVPGEKVIKRGSSIKEIIEIIIK